MIRWCKQYAESKANLVTLLPFIPFGFEPKVETIRQLLTELHRHRANGIYRKVLRYMIAFWKIWATQALGTVVGEFSASPCLPFTERMSDEI